MMGRDMLNSDKIHESDFYSYIRIISKKQNEQQITHAVANRNKLTKEMYQHTIVT